MDPPDMNSVSTFPLSPTLQQTSAPAPLHHHEAIRHGGAAIAGRDESLWLRPGLLVMLRDMTTVQDLSGEKECGSGLHIGLILEAAGFTWLDGDSHRYPLQPGTLSVMTSAGAARGGFSVPAGTRIRLVDFRFEDAYFRPLLTPAATVIPPTPDAVRFPAGTSVEFTYRPLPADLRLLAERLLAAPTQGASARLLLEARAFEVLSLALSGLMTDPAPPKETPGGPPLSGRDRSRLQTAYALLSADLENPPPLRELARQVGLNENKLKQGFRSLFGNSVYATVQELRMKDAARRLAAGEASVTEIALAVGYANPAHFAKIFRRYYGVSPSRYAATGG